MLTNFSSAAQVQIAWVARHKVGNHREPVQVILVVRRTVCQGVGHRAKAHTGHTLADRVTTVVVVVPVVDSTGASGRGRYTYWHLLL